MATEQEVMGALPAAPPIPDAIHTFSPTGEPGDPAKVPAGFTLAREADATYLDDALAAVRVASAELLSDAAEAVLRPDAGLAHVRGAVRPAILPVIDEWDAKATAHLADPDRRWLSPEGRQH